MQAVDTNPGFDPVEERIAAPRLLALGFQHVLVMYAGAIAVPLIVGRALQLSPQDVAFLISADLFVCGISCRYLIHWPSFYNVVTGKTLALPNLIALQHIPLSPAGVIAKRPAPIALPNSCAA